jgi:hypothetical protein
MSIPPAKSPPGILNESDFYAWTQTQSQAIAEHRWNDVDAINVADEIKSLGLRLEREIGDRLEILLSYLLKWRQLAEYRGFAWKENIDRQRHEIFELLVENPSLAEKKERWVPRAYEHARSRLEYETSFYTTDFPPSCPFTVAQVFDQGYFPEELDAPATGAFPTAQSIGR